VSANPSWRLGYRPGLDGVRGIAILLVVAYHSGFGAREFYWMGFNGVAIFFTLSGFLITRLLLEERADSGRIALGRFYARRALRLLPGFGAMLAVTALIGLASLPDVLRASSYMANWWLAADVHLGPLSHTWSLSIEEQFYLVWPAIVAVPIAVAPRLVAPLLLALTLGYRLLGPEASPFGYDFATQFVIPLVLIGVCLALFWKSATPTPRWSLWVGVALIVIASILRPGEPAERISMPMASLGAAFLLVEGLVRDRPTRFLAARPLVGLGVISYSLYLWHYPVMFALGVAPSEGPIDPAASALSLVLSFVLAILSYRLIERPLVALRKRWRASGKDPHESRSAKRSES
jgi:peptidoglycan/LPS O-acetylase OafA/YrhL